ncbi:hypothetical protein KFK09_021480 [Dendrobium nobile]|uniref:Uncharacterized protein n=1 Tax=Dendrobium nobile TaxID=94219 RepID=A0A8T3APE1_DENNO|nr:hypothetical protein KFK09_021480 [Dendrobium nobile]
MPGGRKAQTANRTTCDRSAAGKRTIGGDLCCRRRNLEQREHLALRYWITGPFFSFSFDRGSFLFPGFCCPPFETSLTPPNLFFVSDYE